MMHIATKSRSVHLRASTRKTRRRTKQSSVLEVVGQVAVGIPILVLPWLFGGVQATAQRWLFVGVLVSLVCYLLMYFRSRKLGSSPVAGAIIPLLLAVGLGVFQIVPLPTSLHAKVAPTSARLWSTLVPSSDTPSAIDAQFGAAASRHSISLYPASTRHNLALLSAAVAVFFVGSRFFCRPNAILALLGLGAANGAALAFFGIAQQLRWEGKLYWTVPLSQGGAPFASFVNRNHAASYLSLSLACVIGLTIWAFSRKTIARAANSLPQTGLAGGSGKRSSMAWLRNLMAHGRTWLANLDATRLFVVISSGIIFAGLLLALSRGAWVAAALAGLFIIVSLFASPRLGLRTLVIVLGISVGCSLVAWLGGSDKVRLRFESLLQEIASPQTRIDHWRDGLTAAGQFLPLGSGLGTYRYVYRLAQTQADTVWYHHAENTYLEALVEGGLVGLGLILAAIMLVGIAAWRLLAEQNTPATFALGIAGFFALISQSVHSFFDFALFMPANMALLALVCGAVCGRSAQLKFERRGSDMTRQQAIAARRLRWLNSLVALPPKRSLTGAVAMLLTIAVTLGFFETRSVAAVETAMREFAISKASADDRKLESSNQLMERIVSLNTVLFNRMDDGEAQQQLALLWIAHYRARSKEQWQANNPGKTMPAELWNRTSPLQLHAMATTLSQQNRTVELEELQHSQPVQTDLSNAASRLLLARRSCPLLSKPHLLLAELAPLLPSVGDDASHLDSLHRVVPTDVAMLKESSLLELQAGSTDPARMDRALKDWRRLAELQPDRLPRLIAFVARDLEMPDRVTTLLPNDPVRLVEIASEHFQQPSDAAIRDLLIEKAEQSIASSALSDEVRHYVQGVILALHDRKQEAIEQITLAVQLNPEIATWRYRLALLLQARGKLDEATKEASLCLRLDPGNTRYDTLLKQLIRAQNNQ